MSSSFNLCFNYTALPLADNYPFKSSNNESYTRTKLTIIKQNRDGSQVVHSISESMLMPMQALQVTDPPLAPDKDYSLSEVQMPETLTCHLKNLKEGRL